jgi:hypothetical protein
MFRIFSVLFLLFTLISCGSGEKIYYPKYHGIVFTTELFPAKGEIYSLNWGDKLIYQGQTISNNTVISNKNITRNIVTLYAKVSSTHVNKTGYIDLANLITNAVVKGVVLNPSAIIRDIPASLPNVKQSPRVPLLAYIVQFMTNDDGAWAQIEPNNVNEQSYYLPNKVPSGEKWVSAKWIDQSTISTNQADVELVIALQVTTKKFNDLTRYLNTSPDPDKQKQYDTKIKMEADNLNAALAKYPQADPSVIAAVQELIGTITVPGSTQQGTIEGTNEAPSGGQKEEL